MKQILCFAMLLGTLCFALNAQWVQTSGPSNHTVFSLAAKDSILFAGTYDGAYLSTDNGNHWSATGTLPSPSSRVLSLAVMGGLVFAGTDAGVCRSSDSETSWKAVDSGVPDRSLVHSIVVSGTKVYAGTHAHGVFFTADSGATWTAIDSGLPPTTSVYSLVASSGPQVIAGTWGSGIFRVASSQTSWIASNSGLSAGATAGYVLSLAASGANVCAGIGGSVYSSADNGGYWSAASPSSIQSDVNGLAASGNDFFAATYSSGVFHSNNNGSSWASISEGLPPSNQGLCLLVKGPYLFFGSGNSGVWRRPLSEVPPGGVRNEFHAKTKAGELGFGTDHILRYELGNESFVSVTVCDLKGRILCVVINGKQGAGRYSLPLRLANFPSGTYVLGFDSGDFASQRRIVVCR